MQKTVVVNQRGAKRVRDGHLWIYRSDIVHAADVEGGSTVTVKDERGRHVGQSLYSDRSEISLRLLTVGTETIDRSWWGSRLHAAIARRDSIRKQANSCRLVYSEGDLLPSLIVDVYGDVVVLQTLSQGTERLKDLIAELLVEELHPAAVIERNDVRVRELEGLPLRTSVLYGGVPETVEANQHGVRFVVQPLAGQKTGSFLDQRENHLAAQRVGRGRALDCFTFNGGFALHLAAVCDRVLGLDISADAVTAAGRNANLNEARNVEFREANVFDALREMETASERFDTIVLDPPAFAKNRASVKAAMRGYKEINLRALKLLNPGGVLITCTCSYHMSEQMFLEIIADAARDAHRRVQLVEKRTQAGDHPILIGMPETYYLKCVIVRVVE